MSRLTRKAIDQVISEAYNRRCSGIQIKMLDIPRIFAVGRAAAPEHFTVPEASRMGATGAPCIVSPGVGSALRSPGLRLCVSQPGTGHT